MLWGLRDPITLRRDLPATVQGALHDTREEAEHKMSEFAIRLLDEFELERPHAVGPAATSDDEASKAVRIRRSCEQQRGDACATATACDVVHPTTASDVQANVRERPPVRAAPARLHPRRLGAHGSGAFRARSAIDEIGLVIPRIRGETRIPPSPLG